MVDRHISPNFGFNSFDGIWGNDVYGRTKDDAWRWRTDTMLVVQFLILELNF